MTAYRDARIYGLGEIYAFFEVVDRHLTTPTSIVVIGGAAAAFHHAESTTSDVDTHEALTADLEAAIARAKHETGLDIPVSHSTVADVPWDFEDRLEHKLPHLAKLKLRILEKHDLALSKIVRCSEHDLQQLVEIHAQIGFDFDTLVERFRREMTHVLGDPARVRGNFLELIERLFGELRRVRAQRAID